MREGSISSLSAVLLIVLLTSLDAASSSSPSLKALCEGRGVKIRTINHLNTLVGQLDSAGEECSPLIKDALNDMKSLTERSDAGVCTMEKAQAITNYVETYLKYSADAIKVKLPKPLEEFAIAYGMKVSGVCSRKMLSEFAYKADQRLRLGFGWRKGLTNKADKMLKVDFEWMEDLYAFEKLLSDRSPLGMVLRPIIKPGELILPVDFMQTVPGMAEHVRSFVPESLGLKKMKLICERVYRPMYESMLLPLAKLIRAGFNTREFYWQKKYYDRSNYWSRAVFICEIVKMIEISAEEQAEISEGTKEKIVADWNEAFKDLEEDDVDEEKNRKLTTVSMSPLEPSETGDTILGPFDFSMRSLVKAFDANKDHVELIRERILRRSFRVFRRMFQMKGFSALLQRLEGPQETGSESKAELERANFEKVKSDLISLASSKKHTSIAYDVLITLPNLLRRFATGIIFYSLVVFPLITAEKLRGIQQDGEKDKVVKAINFSYNWLYD